MLGAHALSIAWQDTLVFWRWRSLTESRSPLPFSLPVVFSFFHQGCQLFPIYDINFKKNTTQIFTDFCKEYQIFRFSKVAELLAVCWLEIKGNFRTNMLTSKTNYATYLVYKIGYMSHGLDFTEKTLGYGKWSPPTHRKSVVTSRHVNFTTNPQDIGNSYHFTIFFFIFL